MNRMSDTETSPRDDAARAGWLYYVGGLTQDQIARQLGVSRQSAQRLVSRAMSERLIHVRLEHRVAACLDLEAQLIRKYDLRLCRVALGLAPGADPLRSIGPTAAAEIERILSQADPLVIALSTGRTLRAAVEELTQMDAVQHKIVSLIGNIAPDGTASHYDVIIRMSDKVNAPHFPMPVPVIAETPADRELYHSLKPVRRVTELASNADVCFVGIGQMSRTAPLFTDGFISAAELGDMEARDAAGEIAGSVYDSAGRYIEGGTNARICGVRVTADDRRLIVGLAAGEGKVRAMTAALKGRLINGLITDETTAASLLS